MKRSLNSSVHAVLLPALCWSAIICWGCKNDDNPATAPQPPQPQAGPYFHQIYSASSSDGLNWRFDDRKLLDHASVPAAIVTPEGKLRIYYVDASQAPENTNCAESSDGGVTFTVLGCTIANRANDKALDPSIVLLPDGRYRLYYYASRQDPNTQDQHSIYSAISSDGIHFTQEQEVFKREGLVDPDVFQVGNEWLMYVFSLKEGATIIAHSSDGLNFIYHGLLGLRDWGTTAPVKLDDGGLRLYAFNQRGNQAVGSFVSSDALNWTQEAGVRFSAPAGWQVTDPFVVRMPDRTWKMVMKMHQ